MKVRPYKTFVDRHPLAFSSLFGLAIASIAAIPRTMISTVEDLPPDLELLPSDLQRALIITVSPENLFHLLGIFLASILLGTLIAALSEEVLYRGVVCGRHRPRG